MSSSELKLALKEAKNAVIENKFEEAALHAKAALKIDKNNYQGLVIFGRACQECGKMEDSKNALLLASQIESENPVAWQGLARIIERQPGIVSYDEKVAVYKKLIPITKNDLKLKTYFHKLACIFQENHEYFKACDTLKNVQLICNKPDENIGIWKSVYSILKSVDNFPEEKYCELLESLEHILNESVLGENEENYKQYLQLLYKMNEYETLVKGALKMFAIFSNLYPLEWISRVYIEYAVNYNVMKDIFPLSEDELRDIFSKLLNLAHTSPWGNLAVGCLYMKHELYTNAVHHLKIGTEHLPSNFLSWYLLMEAQEKLKDWQGLEVSCRSAKLLLSISNSCCKVLESQQSIEKTILLLHVRALYYLGSSKFLNEALDMIEKVKEKDLDIKILMVHIKLKLGDYGGASEYLNLFCDSEKDSPCIKLLEIILQKECSLDEDVVIKLEEFCKVYPDNADGLFELGKMYYKMNGNQKSAVCFLKAAKLNSSSASSFHYLGLYYRREGNLEKARKCLEKAHSLNSYDDAIGSDLSDLYRFLGDHVSNYALLYKMTSQTGKAGCWWGWLRLGLHYLSQQQYGLSIQSLLCSVQLQPFDSVGYECLGDAYLARGSYSAALKAFNKVTELNPESLYPLCKIAHIRYLSHEINEAISEYEIVLSKVLPTSVKIVAMIGLAKSFLQRARKNSMSFFYVNVKHDCIYAINILANVAKERPSYVPVWKLLGDACVLLAPLPLSLCKFSIPLCLLDLHNHYSEEIVNLNEVEVMQLGVRCYGIAMKQSPEDGSLWHDLGLALYLEGCIKQRDGNEIIVCDVMHKSLSIIKKSLTIFPKNSKAWNTLGVVASHKAIGNFKLAQHSFIMSIECQPSVSAWTHMGSLYLQLKEIQLAHEAFSQAQALDPSFVACWVGQALVAESIGHADAFDLFQHAAVLNIHLEGEIGHGHHVMKLIAQPDQLQKPTKKALFESCISTATDGLIFYTREIETDVIALNMCGLSLEVSGMYTTAASAYQQACSVIEGDLKPIPEELSDCVRSNYGRALMMLGKFADALKQYKLIKKPDFISQCGFALASYKAEKFEDAYSNYTAALHWLALTEQDKSNILVALAFLQYKFRKPQETKTLLFQSSQMSVASVYGLLALVSLGLLSDDSALSAAAFDELCMHEKSQTYVHSIAFLKAAKATIEGNPRKGKEILTKAVHTFPQISSLWMSLGRHLLTFSQYFSVKNASKGAVAATAAASVILQRTGEHKNLAQNSVLNVFATLKESYKSDNNKCLIQAQRAVLMCPNSSECWALLIAASCTTKLSKTVTDIAKLWIAKSPPVLRTWLQTVAV